MMNETRSSIRHFMPFDWMVLVFGSFTSLFLIYFIVSIYLFFEQFFMQTGTLDVAGVVNIAGMLMSFFFIFISIAWLGYSIRLRHEMRIKDMLIMALGVLCLFLFFGEKVMIDEIAHQAQAGVPLRGEWIILHGFVIVQLLYSLYILYRIKLEQHIEAV